MSIEDYFRKRHNLRAEILTASERIDRELREDEIRLTGSECLKCHSKKIRSKGVFWKCDSWLLLPKEGLLTWLSEK